MKLIKLEINNFRQFYGKQVVDFSVDPEKGVTLIHGENNGGKTALLNALRWCLYEETTENLQDSNNLLNKHAASEGKNTFTVKLQIVHDNRLLEVIRIRSRASSMSKLQVFEIRDGCYSEHPVDKPNALINTFLPKEMSQYFFYQGEGTGTLSSQNDFSHIKEAIDKVLGLTVSKATVKHLQTVKIAYQKDLKQYDSNNEVETLIANKELLVARLEADKSTIENKNIELETAEKEFEIQVGHLARFDKTAIDAQIKLRVQKEQLLLGYIRQYKKLKLKKEQMASSWAMATFASKLAKVDLSKINTEELNNSLRYSVDKQLLKEVLHNHECICGTAITADSAAAQLIEQLGKHAIDPDLKRRWALTLELKSKLEKVSSPKEVMQQLLAELDDHEEKIIELEDEVKELSLTIVDSDIDDIKGIEQKKGNAKSLCDKLYREIPNLEQKIKKKVIDIKDIDIRVMRLSSSQPKAKKAQNLVLATNQILKLYEDSIASSNEGVDLILLQKMQSLFSQVAFNGYTVKKDTNTKRGTFTWTIVDHNGKRVAAGNGYQAMLSISFIVALIEFSKERANNKQHLLTPGTIAPFIADSILAFIGPDNGRELVRYIADKVEQSIFMFSQAQWTESHTDKGIRNKIGKEYNLVQHTVLTEDEFKGQYPTHLTVQGCDYDVVKFGSDFDKVTIEEVKVDGC